MRKILLFSVFAVSFFAASCESEFDPTVLGNGDADVQQPAEEYITLSITAGPSEVELKSLFDQGGPAVKWSTGDIISVIDDKGNLHVSKPSETSAKTLTFVFENWPASCKPVYAIHTGAYNDNVPADTYADGLISTSMESTQEISKAGRFSRTPVIAAGEVVESDGNYSVSLGHAYGLVKLTIVSDGVYSAVKLEGNGNNDALAGDVTLNPATKELKVVNGVKSIQIVNNNGFAAGDYYFCVLPGVITTPKVTFVAKEGGAETSVQNSGNVTISAGVIADFGTLENVTADECEDLSASESANCYIINAAGMYRFKAVQGNSDTALEGVASVEVLWSESTDIKDIVASVEYKNGYVLFSTPETYQYGNALIAARDAEGTILWSWHIWATNSSSYPSDVTYPNGLVMMDRNLGSRGAGKYLSLLYQWGRKDPIPGSAGSGSCVSLVYSSNDLWKTYGPDDTDVAVMSGFTFLFAETRCNIDVAVKNPTTIYGVAGDGDAAFWANGQTSADLWGGSKTVNDPCPPGYKVPSAFDAGAVAADGVELSTSRFADLSSATWSYGNTRTAVAEWASAKTSFVSSAVVDLYGSTGGEVNKYSVRNPKCNDTEGRSYIWTASRTTDNSRRASVLYIRNKITDGKNATSIKMEASPKNNAYAVRCEKIQK